MDAGVVPRSGHLGGNRLRALYSGRSLWGRQGLEYFDYDSNDGAFIVFNTISRPPANGGFGYFAVNEWTGDVWALWGCHRLSTPALRKSQAAIRKWFTPDELSQYARLRRLKPECIVKD